MLSGCPTVKKKPERSMLHPPDPLVALNWCGAIRMLDKKSRNVMLLSLVGLITIAYLIEAFGKVGIWGGVFFIVVWLAVFLRERRRLTR
jgi:hypothetical protein